MDWNNNYEDDDDKCILFHCGPAPASLMLPGGRITDHFILMGTVGEGRGFGCNQGRLKPMDFTFTSLMTEAGRVKMYLGEAKITDDWSHRSSSALPAWQRFLTCRMCCFILADTGIATMSA